MIKILLRLITVPSYLLTTLLLISMPSYASKMSLKICHENNYYPPYIFLEKQDAKGILVDIIDAATKEVNISVELYARPWIRCQQDVISGQAHALFAMVKTEERSQKFAFPPEKKLSDWYLWLAQYPVFTTKNTLFDATSYQTEKGIGAPLGYVVWDILKDKGWLSTYQYEPVEGLKMLAIDRLDGYVVERQIGIHLLEKNKLSAKVEVNNKLILQTQWYLPFNKDFYQAEKALVDKIWRNIAIQRKRSEHSIRLR